MTMQSVPISLWLFLAAIVVWMIFVNVLQWHLNRDGDWHPVGRDRMRRLKDGCWEFREMTEREKAEKSDLEAW
jgi:hypothetical protein